VIGNRELKRLSQRLGIGAVALVLSVSLMGCPTGDPIVAFADPGLEGVVRTELGQPLGFLRRSHLLNLRNLDARNLNIRNLSGLEFATNLLFLDLGGNNISNIGPLTNLVNLTSVNLDGNAVFNLQPLAGLNILDYLSLCDTSVTDIGPLLTNASTGGLGEGDVVNLTFDNLSQQAIDIDVPALQAFGVNVADCGSSSGGDS
jgi:hypothetical protein